jgi:hypothetical protein
MTSTSVGAPDKVKAFRPVWGALERNLPLQGGKALSFDSKYGAPACGRESGGAFNETGAGA